MAYLAPSDLPALALSGGRSAELDTLKLLRRSLSSDYTVFHGVHWSRDWRSIAVFGEADFIVVNNAGAALVIEQKSGGLEEAAEGLFTSRARSIAPLMPSATSSAGSTRTISPSIISSTAPTIACAR